MARGERANGRRNLVASCDGVKPAPVLFCRAFRGPGARLATPRSGRDREEGALSEQPPRRTFFQLFLWFWMPVFTYLAVIFTLSAQPDLTPPTSFENSDKYWHMLEYGGLG